MELCITMLSLKSQSSVVAGRLRILLLTLVPRLGAGVGVKPVSSGPMVFLKSFIALPSAAAFRTTTIRRWTGVLVLLGVSFALAVVGGL